MNHLLKTFTITFIVVACALPKLLAQPNGDSIELRVESPYFSPNGDGIQDQIFFSPVINTQLDITRWRLEIRNALTKKVARMTGAGFSALIKWDGKDKKGNIVPDGNYVGIITVWAKKKKLTSRSEKIRVDTKSPLVEMTVSTNVLDQAILSQEPLEFEPSIDDESPIDRWQFQVLDITGRTVYLSWSSATARTIVWDGTDTNTGVYVPQGLYRCALQAWDKAGNTSEPFFVDVINNISAREMLEQVVLEDIDVVETDLGLLVQLRAKDIFTVKKRKPSLNEEAESILSEVAFLVNAYPDVPVKLDGYSRRFKKASRDQDLSSLYAWSIYSYLVKKGNVKASRLNVRGRGRTPMFERREIDFPILKNGVEILLEGNREW